MLMQPWNPVPIKHRILYVTERQRHSTHVDDGWVDAVGQVEQNALGVHVSVARRLGSASLTRSTSRVA